MRILLVSPDTPVTFWSLKYTLEFLARKALLPPLGLLTVAALLPETWEKRLVDLATTGLRDEDLRWADYVFVGAMNTQEPSARCVIDRCRTVGARIVAGGPLFTSRSDQFEDVDHLVLGEAEPILPRFVKDLEEGQAGHVYRADTWADLHDTPAPRWDLVDVNQYALLPLQYSRGCPFHCDFCDVTALFGHRLRKKTTPQILGELDRIYSLGWRREIFLVDDNFIADPRTLKREVLPALIEWMQEHRYPFSFYTQASLNLADDDELLELLGRAGFEAVFIGIETVADRGLAECHKGQNQGRDLVACVRKIQRFGLEVQGGFILGFDSDPPGVFDDLIKFIQDSGIVTAMVGLLQAYRGTKLRERLEQAHRVMGEAAGNTDGHTNLIPKMPLAQLESGYCRVVETLYSHPWHYNRIRRFLASWRPRRQVRYPLGLDELQTILRVIWRLGIREPHRRRFWRLFAWSLRHPQDHRMVLKLLGLGYHFRKVFAEVKLRIAQGHAGRKAED
jgi:radical SAM superfamily enzyme YgiQ (UPF0313 family)